MGKVNYTNPIERSYYGLNSLAEDLKKNEISVFYDEQGDGSFAFYSKDDLIFECSYDDIENITINDIII